MKNSVLSIMFLISTVIFIFSSCNNDSKGKLVGTWKMARVKLTSSEQQQQMMQSRVVALQDSVSKNTDTAKVHKYQMQLDMLQKRIADVKMKQDSAIIKTQWEFKSNGDFIAYMGKQENKGMWSYDDKLNLLFTIVGKQTFSQHTDFDHDSLTLHLDSVNYFKFVKVK